MTNSAQANKNDNDMLDMHSPNLVDDNVQKIMALFPNCITESEDENGKLKKAVDFDLLRQELSQSLVEGGQERYRLDWPGKRQAILEANSPIAKTLRPARDESVNFDTTENLFIEGDNLEALKLLQESYLGQVKMIYIDPPYNTGNDFIYEDDFSEDTTDFLERSEQIDEHGNRLVTNTESNGRFHSDWLTMMYSRLKLARTLLNDNGVIFVSIDDNEAHNLKKICDEIFSSNNFVADICVVNNLKGRNDKKYIARANERLLMYVKNQSFSEYGLDLSEDVVNDYSEQDEQYGRYRLLELRKRGGPDTRKERPNMFYPFYLNKEDGSLSLSLSDKYDIEVLPFKSNGEEGRWRWGLDTAKLRVDELVGKQVRGTERYNIYQKDFLYKDGVARRVKPKSVMFGADYSTDTATKQYRSLMGKIDFSNPKSQIFLEDLVTYSVAPQDNAIVLDFFAGSSTTAHAVMDVNVKDSGKRKFIMVQFPEVVEADSKASIEGYQNIAEISKERIRRAGQKILADNQDKEGIEDLDIGFRVLKIDSTNMKDVYYTPDNYEQAALDNLESHIKEDRTGEDLLFQVMLDWGVPLSLPIEVKEIQGSTVYYVGINSLVACFDTLTTDLIDEISNDKPLKFVSSELAITHDQDKTNIKARFAQLSPDTQVKFI